MSATYAALVDEARLRWIEQRDHRAAYARAAAKGDRLAIGLMGMDGLAEARQARLADIGRVLAAVSAAHERDAYALAAVIGRPLERDAT